jgi:O-methyltransferase
MAYKFVNKLRNIWQSPKVPPPIQEVIRKVRDKNLTYLTNRKLMALAELCLSIERNHVPGMMIEAGCALGGSSIVISSAKQKSRNLFVYDVFSMIPPPSDQDGSDVHERYNIIKSGQSEGLGEDLYYGYVDNLYDRVLENLKNSGYPIEENNVHLVKGLVQDTLQINDPVSLAHIDVDWYEPVLTCLERIEPHLSLGGTMAIDDYLSWSGCKQAVDAYFKNKDTSRYKFDTSSGSLLVTKLA